MKSQIPLAQSVEDLANVARGNVRRLEQMASNEPLREEWAAEMSRAAKALSHHGVPDAMQPWLISKWSDHILGNQS